MVLKLFTNQPAQEFRDQEDHVLLDAYCRYQQVDAFAELYKRYIHLLIGVCMKYLKNEQDAYDATADVFEKLLHHVHKQKIDNFKNWLYVYTKNHCLMVLRHKEVEAKYIRHAKENGHILKELGLDGVHDETEKQYLIEHLMGKINGLSIEQKTCIKIYYLEERSYAEVAQETGYQIKQVKSYIQNGKRNLKKQITGIYG